MKRRKVTEENGNNRPIKTVNISPHNTSHKDEKVENTPTLEIFPKVNKVSHVSINHHQCLAITTTTNRQGTPMTINNRGIDNTQEKLCLEPVSQTGIRTSVINPAKESSFSTKKATLSAPSPSKLIKNMSMSRKSTNQPNDTESDK